MKRKEMVRNIIISKGVVSKPDYRDIGAILLFIFLIPYIISFFFGNTAETKLFEEDFRNAEFIVCNTTATGTEMMPLETYLVSRLPSTIDMEYEPEALKAQAVVLRTEIMKIYYDNEEPGEGMRQKDGKTYIPVESNITSAEGEIYEKAKEAVGKTKGMYLTYKGQPIKAPYFAVSAGATRNGNEVFESEEYGYLKSVMCERDFTSLNYIGNVRMNKNTFFDRLEEIAPEFDGSVYDEKCSMFEVVRDRAGYVTEINIGGSRMSGEAFRNLFLLNSSCFELTEERDAILIKTKGVGHGLGLCQYGANEAAKKGSDFIDILNYFFSGVVIEKTE